MLHGPAAFARRSADPKTVPFGLCLAPAPAHRVDPGFHHFAEERVPRVEDLVELKIIRPRNIPAPESSEHAPIGIEPSAREPERAEHLVAAIIFEWSTAALLDHRREHEISGIAVGVCAAWRPYQHVFTQ